MKKLISIVLVISIIATMISAMPITASAATSGTCGSNLTWSLDNGTLTITGTGEMTNWSSSSNAPWYSNRESIKSVTIGDSITTIGEAAFYWCDSLTSVTIGDSVTSIGDYAFYDCASLTSVTIGDSVTTIGYDAFRGCGSLTSVTIGDSVTTIGEHAFSYCYSLTSVTIPDSVTTIGEGAFRGCDSLTSINVDVNNKRYASIDGNLFNKSKTELIQYAIGKSAKNYTIPDSVTTIGDRAFYSCDSLTSVTIGDSVTTIGNSAFSHCYSLTSVTIPDSVTSIGGYVFYRCDSLTSVTIPDSVTTIGEDAFSYCYSLTSVTIPDSVTTIGSYAFCECDSLTSVTIPDSVTSIGDYAFYDCDSLTSVTIGDSVTTIGSYAFYDCDSLTSINVDVNNKRYASIDGNLFNKSKTELIQYAIGKRVKNYTILDSVTTIGIHAFSYCDSLTSVTIGDSVTTIGDSAFSYCDSLTSVTIGDSVTTIGIYAFYDCDSLTSVTIPDSVTTIGMYAFAYCDSLTDVYYTGSEEQWNKISIDSYGNNYLKNATIHYNYGKTVNKNTDKNNENNSTITDKNIVHSIPSDINDEIVINRKGNAHGYVILHDKNGEVYANKSVKYTVTDDDGNFLTVLSTTDVNGSVGISTADFENTGSTVITKTVTATFENEDLLENKFTFEVKIAPISYKQSWSGQITAGGAASARQGVFSVGASGEAAKDIALEEVYKDGKRDLHLTSSMDLEAAVNAKVGLYAGKNFLNNDAVDLGSAKGKIAFGNKVGYGLYIEDYDQANVSQRANIEAFLVDSILAVGKSNVLPRMLFDYYLEKRGLTVNNEMTRDLSFTTSGGFNAPEIKFGDFTASIGGISGKGEWKWGKSEDKDNVVTTTTSTECTADRKLFDLGYKKSFKGDGSIGTGTSIYSERFVNNLIELSGSEIGGKIKSIELKSVEDYDISSVFSGSSTTEHFKSIIYEDEAARAIADKSSFVKGLATGGFRLFGIGSSRKVYDLMSVSEHKAKYERTKKHTDTYAKDYDIGISEEFGISFGISGSHTYSYKSQTGVMKDGFVYRHTTSDLDDTIKSSANTFDQLINPIMNGIKADLKEAVAYVKGSVKEGVEWLGAKLKGAAEWTASIVSFDKNTVSLQSYEVLTTTEDNTDIDASSVSTTIGMPYIVSIKDDKGEDVISFEDNPLEITLSYDSEALSAAGLTNTPELLANMRIFYWDESNSVYVCAGGELDFANSSVTCDITKPGQYILAIDNCPPAVTAIEVNGHSSTPQITAVVADMSGIGKLYVTLDGVVVADETNFSQYYDEKESRFTYDVKEPLSAGEHTVAIGGCDSLGNEITEPVTLIFEVDDAAPVIGNVSVTDFSDNREIEVSAEVNDDNLSAVYAEIQYGDFSYSADMESVDGIWKATISDLPKFGEFDVVVKAVDDAGNSVQSDRHTSVVAYSESDDFYAGILDFDGLNVRVLTNNKTETEKNAYLLVNAYDESGNIAETVSNKIILNEGYIISDVELSKPYTKVRAELASAPDSVEYLATGFTAYSDIAELYCSFDKENHKLMLTSAEAYEDVNVVVCTYSGDKLENISLCSDRISAGKNVFDIQSSTEGDNVKIFVWDTNLRPVTDSILYHVPNTEPEPEEPDVDKTLLYGKEFSELPELQTKSNKEKLVTKVKLDENYSFSDKKYAVLDMNFAPTSDWSSVFCGPDAGISTIQSQLTSKLYKNNRWNNVRIVLEEKSAEDMKANGYQPMTMYINGIEVDRDVRCPIHETDNFATGENKSGYYYASGFRFSLLAPSDGTASAYLADINTYGSDVNEAPIMPSLTSVDGVYNVDNVSKSISADDVVTVGDILSEGYDISVYTDSSMTTLLQDEYAVLSEGNIIVAADEVNKRYTYYTFDESDDFGLLCNIVDGNINFPVIGATKSVYTDGIGGRTDAVAKLERTSDDSSDETYIQLVYDAKRFDGKYVVDEALADLMTKDTAKYVVLEFDIYPTENTPFLGIVGQQNRPIATGLDNDGGNYISALNKDQWNHVKLVITNNCDEDNPSPGDILYNSISDLPSNIHTFEMYINDELIKEGNANRFGYRWYGGRERRENILRIKLASQNNSNNTVYLDNIKLYDTNNINSVMN